MGTPNVSGQDVFFVCGIVRDIHFLMVLVLKGFDVTDNEGMITGR